MTNEQGDDDLLELIEAYCNGALDDVAGLEERLLRDAAARELFRRYMALDSGLREYGDGEPNPWVHLQPPVSVAAPDAQVERAPGHASAIRRDASRVRWWSIGIVAVVVATAILVAVLPRLTRTSAASIATLEDVSGEVRLLAANGDSRRVESLASISHGDTIRTRGSDSSTVVAFPDGTKLTLVGNTSVTCARDRFQSVIVHQGMLAAAVQRHSANEPFVVTTPTAQLKVLGTRFQMEAMENRTALSVTEGLVRVTRIRDQETVEVHDGKHATVTERNRLVVEDIPDPPSTWEEDFEAGLPEGWDDGAWVQDGLPQGSRGAVRAVEEEADDGTTNFAVKSHVAWLQGLFAPGDRSHLHVTFKTESRRWINVFFATRTTATEEPRYSGNYLLEDFPKDGNSEWETVTIPLKEFKRIHRGDIPLADVVPFKMMFVSDAPDRGLVIDRVWITPDGPGRIERRAVSAPLPQ